MGVGQFQTFSRALGALVLWISLCSYAAPQEPVNPELHPRLSTGTRQVVVFTNLEKQLLQAIQKKEGPALKRLLADEFQLWMPDSDPIASEDWIPAVMGKFSLKDFFIKQMSVRDFGDTAVVKYVRGQHAEWQGKDDSGEYFVVDVWIKAGDIWKLTDRYVAKMRSVVAAPRPTGKD
ncbi:MAG TPA: nuclear transport factor 2 family protein [Candidatus Angelobacter sp.]|nr:nuclear transport factor 2 family protein [Candidatus Angelobacter sp.]